MVCDLSLIHISVWETIGFDRNCECVGREYTISVICRVEDDIIGNDLCLSLIHI